MSTYFPGEVNHPEHDEKIVKQEEVAFEKEDFIERMEGNESLAEKILENAVQYVPDVVYSLVESINEGFLDEIKYKAHTLNGTSGTVSAKMLYSLAYEMEQDADIGDLETLRRLRPKLSERLDQFLQASKVMH